MELSALAAIDDQHQAVENYRRSGIFAIHFSQRYSIWSHKDQIVQSLVEQVGWIIQFGKFAFVSSVLLGERELFAPGIEMP